MTARRGFSALEVVIGLLLLAVAVAGLQTGGFLGSDTPRVARSDIERLAAERLVTILSDPRYDSLEERYRGIEFRVAGLEGFNRVTHVVHRRDSTDAGVVDFKVVTVTIAGRAMDEPVVRTATVTRARAGHAPVRAGVPGT